jgi:rSAM/selenodomain-associated transferase 1
MSNRMSTSPKNCILFFVKDPVKGGVKSRLAAELDETIAVELYGNFILDILTTLSQCEAQRLICVYPESALEKVKKWLGPKDHYLPQEGKDLGERMKNGFIEAFSMQFENVILIGSDIPDLPLSIVKQAFRMFETHDAVVGPAHDGGYYLIGFRNDTFVPEVFDKMKWGGETVLRSTLNRIKKRGCRVHLLPTWHDVDTLADVMALLQRNKSGVCPCPRTMSSLAGLSLSQKSAG